MEYPFQPNSLYYGDCLEVLAQWPDACVNLIYLDPPFNSKTNYNILFGSDRKSGGGGGRTQVLAFQDTWFWNQEARQRVHELTLTSTPVGDAFRGLEQILGESGMLAYLSYMAQRLDQCRRVLKETGSIYLHCDPTASHYLKILLDAVFGAKYFRNEIVWCYTGPANTKRWFPRKHDTILFYSKSDKWSFNIDDIRLPYSDSYVQRFSKQYKEGSGKSTIFSKGHDTQRNQELIEKGKIPEDYWLESRDGMSPVGRRKSETPRLPHPKTARPAQAHHPGQQQPGRYRP